MCTALQIAHCIIDFKTGHSCPEEEDEIFHSVVVDIFATPQEKSFAVLIACPSKRDGIPVHLTGCIETILRENGDRYNTPFPVIDLVFAAERPDVNINCYRR